MSATLKLSDSHFEFVFGSFNNPIKLVSNPSIKPEYDGLSIKVGEISCALVDSRCNIADGGDPAFADSEDYKIENLETTFMVSDAIKKMKNQFVVPKAFTKSEYFVIDALSMKLWNSVYCVASVRPFASRLFFGKQTEQLDSTVNNQFRSFQYHDESIVDFDPGGSSLCSLFFLFNNLRQIHFRLWWIPRDRGRKGLSSLFQYVSL